MHKEHWWGGETMLIPGRVIHVAEQYGAPTLWYEADMRVRTYHVVMTGAVPPFGGRHVGTFLTQGGHFVGHVYEEAE